MCAFVCYFYLVPQVGLSEVEFRDGQGTKLELDAAAVKVDGAKSIVADRLLNGQPQTTDSAKMWIGEVAEGQPAVRLDFSIPSNFPLATVTVWNYNRYNCETTGARRARLLVAGREVWAGEVPKGPGSKSKRFGLDIPIPAEALKASTTLVAAKPTKPTWDDGTAAAEELAAERGPGFDVLQWPSSGSGKRSSMDDPAQVPSREPTTPQQPVGQPIEAMMFGGEAVSAAPIHRTLHQVTL